MLLVWNGQSRLVHFFRSVCRKGPRGVPRLNKAMRLRLRSVGSTNTVTSWLENTGSVFRIVNSNPGEDVPNDNMPLEADFAAQHVTLAKTLSVTSAGIGLNTLNHQCFVNIKAPGDTGPTTLSFDVADTSSTFPCIFCTTASSPNLVIQSENRIDFVIGKNSHLASNVFPLRINSTGVGVNGHAGNENALHVHGTLFFENLVENGQNIMTKYVAVSERTGAMNRTAPASTTSLSFPNANGYSNAAFILAHSHRISQDSDHFTLFASNGSGDRFGVYSHSSGSSIQKHMALNNGSISLGGTHRNSHAIEIDNDMDVSGEYMVDYCILYPAGTIISCVGTNVPDGYLLCDGAEVSRTTYAALFAAIGVAFGTPSNNTVFRLPDFRGRSPFGVTTNFTLGTYHGVESVTLNLAQIPSHSHSTSIGNHTMAAHTPTISHSGGHNHRGSRVFYWPNDSFRGNNDPEIPLLHHTSHPTRWAWHHRTSSWSSDPWITHRHSITSNSHTHTHTVTNGSTGGGQAHTNMHPFVVLNFFIRY